MRQQKDVGRAIFTSMSHRIVGIVQEIDLEIRPDSGCTTFKTSRKEVLDNPSVYLFGRLAVAFVANSHGRKANTHALESLLKKATARQTHTHTLSKTIFRTS